MMVMSPLSPVLSHWPICSGPLNPGVSPMSPVSPLARAYTYARTLNTINYICDIGDTGDILEFKGFFAVTSSSPLSPIGGIAMAVYRFQAGAFEKLADSLDDLDKTFADWDRPVEAFAEQKGMHLLDEVDAVYQVFTRVPGKKVFSRLREYRWWFRLTDVMDVADDVLIEDSLPDYLAFMGLIQPLVVRARDVAREVKGGGQ